MQVERITTWPELVAIEADWNALAGSTPFRTWDWLATWWKHYGDGRRDGRPRRELLHDRELYVLAVYDGTVANADRNARQLVGIAPWYIDRSALQGSVVRWLGDGEVCTDHGSLICRPHDDERVAAAIAEALADRFNDWDRLELGAVDAEDATVDHLLTALECRNCRASKETAGSCWVLDLPASWDDYLAGISKSHRKQLRRLERRVLESRRVVWHRVQNITELNAAWGVLVELHQRRRQSLGQPGCFAARAFHDFHREVAERLLGRGQLRMSWLELDGTPAAAEYHLADGATTYAYQGGVDPDRLDAEPGRLSMIPCLRQAIEERHQRLDFLRGDEPYKAHWRATPRAMWNYRVVPDRHVARLRDRVWSVADTLGDWARQGAQLVNSSGNK